LIHVIFGEKGAGKTKHIINMANEALCGAKGNIVFIDNNNQYMFDLKHNIRFINASEYHIDGPKMFFGFISGIAAQDFDIEYIFIDGFHKIVHHPMDSLEGLFAELEGFVQRSGIGLVLGITGDGKPIPDYVKKYINV